MPTVTITNFSDFIAAEKAAQEISAKNVQPWAFAVKKGDFFVRTVVRDEHRITIWSEVLPEMEESESEDGDLVEVPYKEGYAYRMTRSYSTWVPNGEEGSVHLSVIDRIVTKEEFEAARERGWK